MKKLFKFIGNIITSLLIAGLLIYLVALRFFPEQLKEWTGYQTFVILTDSMVPTIPVDSLVVVKDLGEKEELSQGEIISFYVDRLGDKVVFTHYFEKKEVDETGKERYYTKAENADRYDDYVTYREDILGTYVYHIPYAGKVVRFLQSPFALLELGLICIFLIIYHILWNKFDREEKAVQEAQAAQACVIPVAPDPEDIMTMAGENKKAEGIVKDSGHASVSELICTTPLIELPPKKTEEVQEEPYIAEDVLFGYRTTPSSGAFENGGAGFTLSVSVHGIVRLDVHKKKKNSKTVEVVTLRKKSLKKIKRIIKDSTLVIQNLPETLDNGYSVGTGSFFNFRGRQVAAWNIKHNNLKKIKLKDYGYYKKHKKNMQYENDVLDIFKKIRNVLKEEGIKINLDSAEIKAGKRS